jgi:hypothetical protein
MPYPINGGRMYLRCGIQTNNPNTIIRWLKNGLPIRRTQPTYYMYNGRILVLMGFSEYDNGRYTCVANDRFMSSSSTRLQYQNPGIRYLHSISSGIESMKYYSNY